MNESFSYSIQRMKNFISCILNKLLKFELLIFIFFQILVRN